MKNHSSTIAAFRSDTGARRLSNQLIVIFIALVSIRLWSFQLIPDGIYDQLDIFAIALMMLILLGTRKRLNRCTLIFKTNVRVFLFAVPLISIVAAYFFHGQEVAYSILALRAFLFWQLYFVLHALNISPKFVLRLVLFIGIVWAILTIIQQFSYPVYFFYTRSDNDGTRESILRAGVYRFMLYRHHYAMLGAFFLFYRYINTRKVVNLILVLLIITGFYYFGTRQFAVALLVCLVLLAMMQTRQNKVFSILVVCVGLAVIYIYKDDLFSEYIEMTTSEAGDADNIRLLSGTFYLLQYGPTGLLPSLLGNGLQHSFSAYGLEIQQIQEMYKLYRSDIGIFGAFSLYGVVYVLNVLWLNVKGLQNKFYLERDKWLKLVFINSLLLLAISEYYSLSHAIPFFCFVFYLVDKSFETKQRRLRQQDTVHVPELISA